MKRIAILGFGREGKTVLQFLKHTGQTSDRKLDQYEFWILDQNKNTAVPRGVRKVLGKNYLENLGQFDIIYRSPGIPYTLPEIQSVKRAGVEISSATELFFEHCPCPVIGVTGTKGKSTTATLIYKMLRAHGKDAYLVGNIGKPALSMLHKLHKNSVVVLELSSFQLQELPYSPHIAVILDTFPDHMDAHKNFEEYIDAKANIAKWQKKSDVIFYCADNKYAKAMAEKSHGKKNPISPYEPYSRELENRMRESIRIPGGHQLKNALMAATVARYLGMPEKLILKTTSSFHGLPHRLELVHRIMVRQAHHKNKSVIYFYNDSASTNPHTAATAVAAFKNPIVLIAGGKDKNLDYGPLARVLRHSTVKAVVLYGENQNKIKNQILNIKNIYQIESYRNLKQSVGAAYRKAKSLTASYQSPVTILLSPASTSFDQFFDYKHRGEEFKRIVARLK